MIAGEALMTSNDLILGARKLRQVAEQAGSLHAYWDLIRDAEAIAHGQPSILARESVSTLMRRALAEITG